MCVSVLVWNSVLYTCMYIHFQHVEFRKQWKVDTILEDFEAPEVGGEREGGEGGKEGGGEERGEGGREGGGEERGEGGREGGGEEGGEGGKEGGGEEGRKSFVLCFICSGSITQCTQRGTREGGGGVHWCTVLMCELLVMSRAQVLKLYYPRAIYGVDRDGDPISYNAIGNIDFRGVLVFERAMFGV